MPGKQALIGIRKLCSLSSNNTRKAIFEFNKLIRSIYTLKCILNPKILPDVHRSQNRIETYHTLRAVIAKTGGRKTLLERSDIEIEISNQCGRLIAEAIICYNVSIHSCFLDADPHNKKKLKILSQEDLFSIPTKIQLILITLLNTLNYKSSFF